MARRHYRSEEIIAKLREAEILLATSSSVPPVGDNVLPGTSLPSLPSPSSDVVSAAIQTNGLVPRGESKRAQPL